VAEVRIIIFTCWVVGRDDVHARGPSVDGINQSLCTGHPQSLDRFTPARCLLSLPRADSRLTARLLKFIVALTRRKLPSFCHDLVPFGVSVTARSSTRVIIRPSARRRRRWPDSSFTFVDRDGSRSRLNQRGTVSMRLFDESVVNGRQPFIAAVIIGG